MCKCKYLRAQTDSNKKVGCVLKSINKELFKFVLMLAVVGGSE
jgi:hypothetical protein